MQAQANLSKTDPTNKRRLVLCLDGTWNSTYELRKDSEQKIARPSNVLKIARAIHRQDPIGVQQIVYYSTGVGASTNYPGKATKILSLVDRALGGAFGAGFHSKVEEAVTFLSNNYKEGDEVFIFGFSRGAATARSVCQFLKWLGSAKNLNRFFETHPDFSTGKLLKGGIVGKQDAYFIPFLLRFYFQTKGEVSFEEAMKNVTGDTPPFSASSFSNQLLPITVKMLGVFDTVLALSSALQPRYYEHLNSKEVPLSVENVFHALAIDENRLDFQANIWSTISDVKQYVDQRWFAGTHSNIGGGHADGGLANCTLDWMVSEAKYLGLSFVDKHLAFYEPKPQGVLYNSKRGKYAFLDWLRSFYRKDKGKRVIGNAVHESVDFSVFLRLLNNANLSKGYKNDTISEGIPYRPENLKDFLQLLVDEGGAQKFVESLNKQALGRKSMATKGVNLEDIYTLLKEWRRAN